MAVDVALHEALRDTAREVLGWHALWELRRSLELLGYWALYRPTGLGLAYGMPLRRALRRGDPVGAVGDRFPSRIPLHHVGRWRRAVGATASVRLPKFLQQARMRALLRIPLLQALPRVKVLGERDGEEGVWPFFMLLLPSRTCRDDALKKLWTSGLGVSRLFIHALPDYPQLNGMLVPNPVPNARDFADRSLMVSNSPWLDDARFDAMVKLLRSSLDNDRFSASS